MQITAETPRKQRTIAGLLVMVPQPYAAGQTINEGEAAMLNQTLAENISNNTRARAEVEEGEGEAKTVRKLSAEEFQAKVDEYVAKYEPGVRQGGGGAGTRALTPVEREMRNIATEKLSAILQEQGIKRNAVNFTELRDQILEEHADALRSAAEKIVKQREKQDIDLGGLQLPGMGTADATDAVPAEDAAPAA